MAQQDIGIGVANAKTGDNLFQAFTKVQSNFDELFNAATIAKRIVVNTLADLPTAIGGAITLVDNRKYFQADDLDLSTTRLIFGVNTSWDGLGSLTVTLSYVGTLPLFTMLNTSNSVSNINITHPNSPMFSYSDNGAHVLRVTDVTYSGSSIGTFGGTNSGLRLTNFSGSSTANGMLFTGNWHVFLFEPTGSILAAGKYIDLGTATFDAIRLNETGLNYVSGVIFLSGLANSGNINTNGLGLVASSALSGGGTPLNGINPNDALWEFSHNNTTQNSKSSGILRLQGNTVETVIALKDTPVLIAGAWAVGTTSQFTGTTGGRLTYNSAKPDNLPITVSISIEPKLSTGIKISLYIAIDGVVVATSKSQGTASAGNPTRITIIEQELFTEAKYIEVYAENNTNATNLIGSSGTLRIH